jgi:hypothetical protein
MLAMAACGDTERPTEPEVHPVSPLIQSDAVQAAKGNVGTKPYGIRAHGLVLAHAGSPPTIFAGTNVLSVWRPQTGMYCVELPADVSFTVALVNPYPVGQAYYSQSGGLCEPAHAMAVFTRTLAGTAADDISFSFIVP